MVVKTISPELVLLVVLLLLDILHICRSFLNPSLLYPHSNLWTKNDYLNRAFLANADMYSAPG